MLSGCAGGFPWGGQAGSCRSKPVGCAGDMGGCELCNVGALGSPGGRSAGKSSWNPGWFGSKLISSHALPWDAFHWTMGHLPLDQRLHPHPDWQQGWNLPLLPLELTPSSQSRVCPAAQPWGEGAVGASLAPLPPAQHLLCLLSSHQPGLCCSSPPCVQCQGSVAGKALGAEQIPPAQWAPAVAEPPRLPLALPECPHPQQPPGHVPPVSLGQLCSPCTSGSAHPVPALCADVFMGWRGKCWKQSES